MSLACYFCGRGFNDFGPLAEHVKIVHRNKMFEKGKGEKMAPKEQYPDPQQNADFNPWLTTEALGKAGKAQMTILGNPRPSTSQFGDGVIVDVRLGNSEFSWTVKFSSGNYGRLVKMMGKPNKWKGKVSVEVKEYMGREYVAIV